MSSNRRLTRLFPGGCNVSYFAAQPERIVSGHKFKIGQLVNYLGRDRAYGVYQITQLKCSSIALRTSTSPMSA
jgi:hypothetical protein